MAVVKADKDRLLIDFMWKGQRCREYLGLDDTKEGNARAKQRKMIIEGAIAAGTLDYATEFPKSKKVRPGAAFAPPPGPGPLAGPPALTMFAREFIELRKTFGSTAYYLDRKSLLETHLIPFFGTHDADGIRRDRLVSEIHIEDVERFMAHMKSLPGVKGETMSSVRVNKARSLMREIIGRAVKKGWLSANPADDVPRLRENPADIDPLSWAEVALLRDKGLKHDPEMQRFYTVAIFTGLRTSELIGLKWTAIDWNSTPPIAKIAHAFTKHDGLHLTKTRGSARDIQLRPQVVRALKEQQAVSRLKSDFVFCSAVGGPLDRDNVMNRTWYPALKRAGIRERTPYQVRHSFATLALSAGEAIGWGGRADGPHEHEDDHRALLSVHSEPDPCGRPRLRQGRCAGRTVERDCRAGWTTENDRSHDRNGKGLRSGIP